MIFWFYSRFQLLGVLVTGSLGLRVHGPLKPAKRALKREGLRGEEKRQSPGGPGTNAPPFSPSRSILLSILTVLTRVSRFQGALSIPPKIPEISVGTSNGPDHFGLVRPEYSGTALASFEGGPL